MNEQIKQTEDKPLDTNKRILNLSKAKIEQYMLEQIDLPLDHERLDMDRVIKINRQFSGQVLLDEGKNTANIGLNTGGGGFNVTFVETVAEPSVAIDEDDDTEESTIEHD